MPLYDFTCEACGAEFEELTPAGTAPPCPMCGAKEAKRRWSSPVGAAGSRLETTGKAARESNARRGEREAKRKERFVAERKQRRTQ